VVPDFSLTENLALAEAGDARGLMDWGALGERTTALLATADVRASGARMKAGALSGGNQQKFVVARERLIAREALVAEHPTRGLDLRASARVLDELRRAASDDGLAVVVHSPDLDEVLSVATRVVACFGGRLREVPWPADRDDRGPFARALVGAD
jgi:simple sugar transport system ATP-binding protein